MSVSIEASLGSSVESMLFEDGERGKMVIGDELIACKLHESLVDMLVFGHSDTESAHRDWWRSRADETGRNSCRTAATRRCSSRSLQSRSY